MLLPFCSFDLMDKLVWGLLRCLGNLLLISKPAAVELWIHCENSGFRYASNKNGLKADVLNPHGKKSRQVSLVAAAFERHCVAHPSHLVTNIPIGSMRLHAAVSSKGMISAYTYSWHSMGKRFGTGWNGHMLKHGIHEVIQHRQLLLQLWAGLGTRNEWHS